MIIALIMAGGSGSRMKSSTKKQFILINGRPLIAHTIDVFTQVDDIDQIIIVAPQDDQQIMLELCQKEFPELPIKIVSGGKTRQNSVINGLNSCPNNTEYVLIHDAVRPFITPSLISELITLAQEHKAVIPASPLRYTVKKVKANQITETVPRQNLYNAHTPQVFDYQLIKSCHFKALEINYSFTDDSSILEYFQIPVHILEVDDANLKITQPQDLEIASYLLTKSGGKS